MSSSQTLGETLRVLRDGGRLVASTWGRGGGTPSSGTVVELLQRHGATDKGYTLDEETWQYPEREASCSVGRDSRACRR